MSYAEKLNHTKGQYPFERWQEAFEHGMKQYTEENCASMRAIFDALIGGLIAKGETASEEEKVALFKIAIEATNELDGETGMVETGEGEDLWRLTNIISVAVGFNPDNYGGGEGLASEWRDW